MISPVFPRPPEIFPATLRHGQAGDVDDDGIVRRAALDLENLGDGLFIQRVGGEAIDRFRRQRGDFASAQQIRRAADGGLEQLRRVRGQDFGLGLHAGQVRSKRARQTSFEKRFNGFENYGPSKQLTKNQIFPITNSQSRSGRVSNSAGREIFGERESATQRATKVAAGGFPVAAGVAGAIQLNEPSGVEVLRGK